MVLNGNRVRVIMSGDGGGSMLMVLVVGEDGVPMQIIAVHNGMITKWEMFWEEPPLFFPGNSAIFCYSWVGLENESLPGSGQVGVCSNI